ncbi:MAG: 1-acyl-sn-glycerol-3-phosphate acyltransferase [Eubacteriales bacterium]
MISLSNIAMLRNYLTNNIAKFRVRKIKYNEKQESYPIKNIIIKESVLPNEATIYVTNHSNVHDLPTAIQYTAGDFAIVATKESLNLVTRILFDIVGVIYVSRGEKSNKKSLEQIKNHLLGNRKINNVYFFSEATWCFSPNQFMYMCRKGASMVAQINDKPVVPHMFYYEDDICYLNEGPRLYFYAENTPLDKIDARIQLESNLPDVRLGKRVIICKDSSDHVIKFISHNKAIHSVEYLLDNYSELVNNYRTIDITYIYMGVSDIQGMEIIRSEIATMMWYLYESFGVKKNTIDLKIAFDKQVKITQDEYPGDYEKEQKKVFRPYENYDDVFSPLEKLKMDNKFAKELVEELNRIRTQRTMEDANVFPPRVN